jgi:hypothetical protein
MTPPRPTAIRAQLSRILASPGFQTSPRAAAFLSHVVEKTLAGRRSEIKEVTIGVEVFGRMPSYDTKSDAIVRSTARVLREKLNDYYVAAGSADPLRIELPKGTYVPVFRLVGEAEEQQPAPPQKRPSLRVAAAAAMVFLAALLAFNGPGRFAADPAVLYRTGRARLLAGDYAGARPLLERAVQLAAAGAPVHAALASDLLFLGREERALEEARRALEYTQGLSEADALESDAVFREANGDHRAAVEIYSRLAGRHPERLDYGRSLARARMNGRDPECLNTVSQLRQALGTIAVNDPQLNLIESFCRAASGDYVGAIAPARAAAALAARVGVRDLYARARLLEAGLLMSTGHAEESRPIREEARRICSAIADDACTLKALRVQGNLDVSAKPRAALREYQAALALARRLGSQREAAELLRGEGVALMLSDDTAGASAAFTEALVTFYRLGAQVYGERLNLVELALRQGQLGRASVLAEEVARDARAANDPDSEGEADTLHADVLRLQGDLDGARAWLKTARPKIETPGLPLPARAHWNLASAALDRIGGKLDAADQQLAAARAALDPANEADLRIAEVELLLDEGRYGDAARAAVGELAALSNRGNVTETMYLQALAADASGYAGDTAKAAQIAQSALAALSAQSAPTARIAVLAAAARWEAAPSKAESHAAEAIDLARRTQLLPAGSEARLALLENNARNNRPGAQLALAQFASEMMEHRFVNLAEKAQRALAQLAKR